MVSPPILRTSMILSMCVKCLATCHRTVQRNDWTSWNADCGNQKFSVTTYYFVNFANFLYVIGKNGIFANHIQKISKIKISDLIKNGIFYQIANLNFASEWLLIVMRRDLSSNASF